MPLSPSRILAGTAAALWTHLSLRGREHFPGVHGGIDTLRGKGMACHSQVIGQSLPPARRARKGGCTVCMQERGLEVREGPGDLRTRSPPLRLKRRIFVKVR